MNIFQYTQVCLFLLSVVCAAHTEVEKLEEMVTPTTCLTLQKKNGKYIDLKYIEVNIIDFFETNSEEIRQYLAELKKDSPDQRKILEIGYKIQNSQTNLAADRRSNKKGLREDYEAYKEFLKEHAYKMKTESAKNMEISPKKYLKIVRRLRDFIYK